jgi:hypothetical protein
LVRGCFVQSIHSALAKETRQAMNVIATETGVSLNTGSAAEREKKRSRRETVSISD